MLLGAACWWSWQGNLGQNLFTFFLCQDLVEILVQSSKSGHDLPQVIMSRFCGDFLVEPLPTRSLIALKFLRCSALVLVCRFWGAHGKLLPENCASLLNLINRKNIAAAVVFSSNLAYYFSIAAVALTSYPQHCLGPRAGVTLCNSGIDTCTYVVNTLKPSGGICYIVILTGTHRAADNSLSFIGKIRRCRLCFVARFRYRQQVTRAAIGIDRRAKRWHWVPPIDP